MIKGDFHTHINGGDVKENARLIARIAKENGFTHIGLGCHEWVCPEELAKMISKEFKIKVIRFAECCCEDDVHLLALNVKESDTWSLKYHPVELYIDEIRRQKGKAVMAHPYNKKVFDRVYKLLDGVEEWNVLRAMRFDYVKDYDIQKFNSSNFHAWENDPFIMGTYTKLPDNWFKL